MPLGSRNIYFSRQRRSLIYSTYAHTQGEVARLPKIIPQIINPTGSSLIHQMARLTMSSETNPATQSDPINHKKSLAQVLLQGVGVREACIHMCVHQEVGLLLD